MSTTNMILLALGVVVVGGVVYLATRPTDAPMAQPELPAGPTGESTTQGIGNIIGGALAGLAGGVGANARLERERAHCGRDPNRRWDETTRSCVPRDAGRGDSPRRPGV